MLYWVSLSILLLDQLSKAYIKATFDLHESVPILNNIFHITYIRNTGAAFGILAKYPYLLAIISILVIIAIVIFQKAIEEQGRMSMYGYSLVMGGALGNLIDRIYYGSVIDFLDFRIWPVFNLADTFICIGVGLLFLCTLLSFKKDQ